MNTDYPAHMRLVHLNYYVVFRADPPAEVYTPITTDPLGGLPRTDGGRMHGFDPELENILPAIWYCLHLPRCGLDVLDLSVKTITKGYSVPHGIYPVPSYYLPDLTELIRANGGPAIALVVSDDECFESARKFAEHSGAPLGAVRVSDLSPQLLQNHWAEIAKLMCRLPGGERQLEVQPHLYTYENKRALPLVFTANQFGFTDEINEYTQAGTFGPRHALSAALHLHSYARALEDLEDRALDQPSEAELKAGYRHRLQTARMPLVLTLPGTARRHQRRVSDMTQNTIPATERLVIDLLATHRAAARTGVLLEAGVASTALFDDLNKLEEQCRTSRPNNRSVWKKLKRIGEQLATQIGADGMFALGRASHVTAITDFPIGLAILPGIDDPLCCTRPISYRPLTPLTRAFQSGLRRVPEFYIGQGFKVIIAECLSRQDRIRPFSDAGWAAVREMLDKDGRVILVYREVGSLRELREFLGEHSDAGILVISAHGKYSPDSNFAGLCVGNDVWLGDEDDLQVPPLVILSACHVAPRGVNAVTVSDLLLRAGAMAVLGTLIPVDVTRNAILTSRLFTYLAEALAGGKNFRSLDEAWQWVTASNAVHEVIAATSALSEWAHRRSPGRLSPIEDFKLHRSVGRLRPGHIYTDTVTVLRELASESGMGQYFDSVMSSQGFFPESCFYVMLGTPENILLHEPVVERFRATKGEG